MSHERDELAQLIDRTIDQEYSPGDDVMGADLAPAILAAGYRRPRTITTVEELDALENDSVVMSEAIAYQKYGHDSWAGDGRFFDTRQIALPAEVLHEPVAQS